MFLKYYIFLVCYLGLRAGGMMVAKIHSERVESESRQKPLCQMIPVLQIKTLRFIRTTVHQSENKKRKKDLARSV